MSKLSTRCMENFHEKEKKDQQGKCSPKKQTLDFLKQFARVYHVEPSISSDLCGYVLN